MTCDSAVVLLSAASTPGYVVRSLLVSSLIWRRRGKPARDDVLEPCADGLKVSVDVNLQVWLLCVKRKTRNSLRKSDAVFTVEGV